jgi:hypothetical protein
MMRKVILSPPSPETTMRRKSPPVVTNPVMSNPPWDVVASLLFCPFWCFNAKGNKKIYYDLSRDLQGLGNKHMRLPFFKSLCPLYYLLCLCLNIFLCLKLCSLCGGETYYCETCYYGFRNSRWLRLSLWMVWSLYISTWQLQYVTLMHGMIMRHMAFGIIHGWVYHYGRVWSLYLNFYISLSHLCHMWYFCKLFPISLCWECLVPNACICIQTQITYMHTFRGSFSISWNNMIYDLYC